MEYIDLGNTLRRICGSLGQYCHTEAGLAKGVKNKHHTLLTSTLGLVSIKC